MKSPSKGRFVGLIPSYFGNKKIREHQQETEHQIKIQELVKTTQLANYVLHHHHLNYSLILRLTTNFLNH